MKLEHPDRLMNRSSLSLAALECHDAFAQRHIGPDAADQHAMLDALGFASRAAFIDAVIPEAIRRHETLPLGAFTQPKSEAEALASLRKLADQNLVFRNYIGQGYYGTHTPAVILRNVLENPAWYTAYTPYQPEISQGRLEALLNFQQMVIDLTGLAMSNASLLDEATAAAEAMTLLQRVGKPKSNLFYIADDVLPQTIEVVQTRAKPAGIEVKVGPAADAATANAFGVLLQYPGANGDVHDYRALTEAVHAAGGFVIAAADLLALTLLTPPGEWGADVAIGNTQRFGVPVGFGGPHAAYMAVRDDFKRQMPGRLVGVHCRRPRQARAASRAANARTAYPSREGDFECMYGASVARDHGQHVRRVSRTARLEDHCVARESRRVHLRGRRAEARLHARERNLLRYRHHRERREYHGVTSGGVGGACELAAYRCNARRRFRR